MIDGARASKMRSAGLSWRVIGEQLAREVGRRVAYKPESVRIAAVKYARRMIETEFNKVGGGEVRWP